MANSCSCGCGSTTSKTVSGTVSSTANISGRIWAPTFVSAYSIAVNNGFKGTEEAWLESLKGADGKSAYQIAVDNGFEGTEEEWLASLVGEQGPQGLSAYEVAVEAGFEGTEEEWLASLKGEKGEDGKDGPSIHNLLTSREDTNCHPISAITDLDTTLSDIEHTMDGKLDEVPTMSQDDILDICT